MMVPADLHLRGLVFGCVKFILENENIKNQNRCFYFLFFLESKNPKSGYKKQTKKITK